jgi:hypothetical protein
MLHRNFEEHARELVYERLLRQKAVAARHRVDRGIGCHGIYQRDGAGEHSSFVRDFELSSARDLLRRRKFISALVLPDFV